jgi:hypothetical protein
MFDIKSGMEHLLGGGREWNAGSRWSVASERSRGLCPGNIEGKHIFSRFTGQHHSRFLFVEQAFLPMEKNRETNWIMEHRRMNQKPIPPSLSWPVHLHQENAMLIDSSTVNSSKRRTLGNSGCLIIFNMCSQINLSGCGLTMCSRAIARSILWRTYLESVSRRSQRHHDRFG